jgi:Biopolymer transport protein
MVASPLVQNSVKVELPSGNIDEAGVQKQIHELVVYIDRAGKLYLNGDLVAEKQLIQKIQQKIGKNTDQTVIVKADQGISYGTVVELVDSIKYIGGIKYVALATQKAHSGKGAAA